MSEARMPYSAPEAMPIRWSIQEHQDGRSIVLAPGERLELVNDSDRERRVVVPAAGSVSDAEAEVERLRVERDAARASRDQLARDLMVAAGIDPEVFPATPIGDVLAFVAERFRRHEAALDGANNAVSRWMEAAEGEIAARLQAEADVDRFKAEVERLRADHRKAKRAAGRAIAERRLAEALVPGGILADQAERLDGLKSKLVDKIKAEVDGLRAERDAILRWAVSYSGYYEDEVRRLAGPDATTTEETNPDGR